MDKETDAYYHDTIGHIKYMMIDIYKYFAPADTCVKPMRSITPDTKSKYNKSGQSFDVALASKTTVEEARALYVRDLISCMANAIEILHAQIPEDRCTAQKTCVESLDLKRLLDDIIYVE
jgi:hypothetical protein